MISALGLSLEQREKLNSLFKQADKQRETALSPPKNDLTLLRGVRPDKIERDLMKKALTALTPEQRQKFDGMKGKKLDLNATAPPAQRPPAGAIQLVPVQPSKNNN